MYFASIELFYKYYTNLLLQQLKSKLNMIEVYYKTKIYLFFIKVVETSNGYMVLQK